MRMILEIVSGPFGEREHSELSRFLTWLRPGDSLRVGRSGHGTDMCVASDRRMSSTHFAVSCEEDGCFISDLKSTNGTFVNGQQIEGLTQLYDGDQVRAGDTIFAAQVMDPNRTDATGGSSLEIDRVAPDPYGAQQSSDGESEEGFPLPHFSVEIIAGPSAPTISSKAFLGELSSATLKQGWLKLDEPLTVGSSRSRADFFIEGDKAVDPIHLLLQQHEEVCQLTVCEGSESVAVNNIKLRQGELSGGERIQIGETVLLLRCLDRRGTPPTQVPPKQKPITVATEKDVSEKLAVFSQGQRDDVDAALRWFEDVTPIDNQRHKVCQKLVTFTRSNDPKLRQQAAKALCEWAAADDLPHVQRLLETADPVVLNAAISGIVRIGELKNVEPVVKALKDPARHANVLKAIANQRAAAEKLGIRLLMHEDPAIQLAACEVLTSVGGRQSVLALKTKLQRASHQDQGTAHVAAQNALEAVEGRI